MMDKKKGGMENPSHQNLNQRLGKTKTSDHSIKNTSYSKMGGPRKRVFKRSHFQNSSSSHDVSHHRPTHRRQLRLQDEEDNQEQENETMESVSPHISHVRRVLGSSVTIRNEYEEVHHELEHEVDFVQSETNISEHQQDENIGSTSHGTTNTRKESRALTEGKKSRLNKGNLVFEVDECAGRIVGEDSQLFITKGGCVMREHAKFDGTTWKNQSPSLKTDIINKCTENSNFDPNCESMVLAIHTQLSSQHRNKQHKLHKYYKTFLTKEEALTHPPKRIKVSDWVNLCERFSSDDFQKISIINKRNRSFNEVPPAIGTVSVARIVDMKRRQGVEVSAIDRYKIAHFSEKKNKMVNEKAGEILHDLQNEEATSSCTPAEICLKKLNRIPGHIKGRSTSMNKNLRMELELEKERTKDLEGKLRIIEEEQLQFQQEQVKVQEKQVKLQEEHSNMKEQMQMMMKELARLSKVKSKKRA